MELKRIVVDAANQPLGRLAARVANLLRGKGKSEFVPYRDMGDTVVVQNIEKIKITGRKLEQKKYRHHTGFPGGLRTQTMKEIFAKAPQELLQKAVWGMLPANKLRARQIKRLEFEGK